MIDLSKFFFRKKVVVMDRTIKNEDILGRAVFSNRQARKAIRGMVEDNIFLERLGASLSVDRFGFCSTQELTNIQNKNAEIRSQKESRKRSFYGWVNVEAKIARRNHRRVYATPMGSNSYHAEIILPKDIDRDEQITHARELASNTTWTSKFDER